MPKEPNGTNGGTNTNGGNVGANGAKRSTETKTEESKAALDTAIAQVEIVRGDFRNAIAGLNKLGELLKQAQRENKTSDKEIQSVRQTLRSLQGVRI